MPGHKLGSAPGVRMPSEDQRRFSLAWKVFIFQCAVGVAGALVARVIAGQDAAFAALYGALVAALPMAWMARRVLSAQPGASPQAVVGGFFRGELGKFGLTAVLFFIGVALFAKQFLSLILTFTIAQVAYGAVLVIHKD